MPLPASRRRSITHPVVIAILATTALASWLAAVPGTAGVEPSDSRNLLDHPIVDLALLDAAGPDGAPRLLVVDAVQRAPGVVRIALLRRDRSWGLEAELTLDTGLTGVLRSTDVPGTTPWLIGLGPTRFALIVVAPPPIDRTVVVGIQTDAGAGRSELSETARQEMSVGFDDAGAADVDGDGTAELVLGSARTARNGGTCQGSTLQVLDGATLAPRAAVDVPGRRLAGSVVGRWDDVPGDDLLGYAYPNCPAGPDTASEVALLALRLSDGGLILEEVGIAPDAAPFVGPPARIDLDGTGTHEAIAMSGDGLAVLDPASGWLATPLGSSYAVPIIAGDDPDVNGRAVRIAWTDLEDQVAIATARVRRDGDGTVGISARDDLRSGEADASRLEAAYLETIGAVQRQTAPAGWLGSTTEADCDDLIVAGAILPCGETELRAGAAWIGTRPVTVLADGQRRRLFIAAGLALDPSTTYPMTPTPWATGPAGWWRHGPSGPFALSEMRAGDVTYFRDFPVPRASIERTTTPDATTDLPGFTGARLFVRVTALAADVPDPTGPPTLDEALVDPSSGSANAMATRISVPPGVEAGRDGGFATIPLGNATLPGGSRADRWSVSVVALNDWGELGPPARGVVVRDAVGPFLVVEAPFTSPVWPLAASLDGSAEPRSIVHVEGVGEMVLDRRGRFTIQTALAPWPQTLRVTATDASGNVTERDVSVVGGIDYRRFPWSVIAAMALLLVVGASGLRGAGRRRGGVAPGVGGPAQGYATADGAFTEMEDLPPGGGLA